MRFAQQPDLVRDQASVINYPKKPCILTSPRRLGVYPMMAMDRNSVEMLIAPYRVA
jgi:hypothetical protein